jgi:hypothetical protein
VDQLRRQRYKQRNHGTSKEGVKKIKNHKKLGFRVQISG